MSTLLRRGDIASAILIGGGAPSAVVPYITGTPPAGVPTQLIFDDEFNTGTLNTNIWTPHWYTSTQNATTMSAANVTMGSGGVQLALPGDGSGSIITTNPDDGVAGHTGYWVPSPTAGNVYVEWKFTVAAVSGVIANWPSVWLEGVDQDWPTQGEIDIMEGLDMAGSGGQAAYHTHWGTAHNTDLGGLGGYSGSSPGAHVYGCLWTTSAITWVYDGVVVATHTFASQAEITAMNYQKMLNAENAISYNGTNESYPATCTVRYCRVWQNSSVDPGPTLGSIPNQGGTVNEAITPILLSASGGVLPYSWTEASLPTGLAIASTTGTISGTPTAVQDPTVTVTVRDANSIPASSSFSFNIVQGGSGTGLVPYNPNGYSELAGFNSSNIKFDDEFTGTSLDTSLWVPYWFSDGGNVPGYNDPGQSVIKGYAANSTVTSNGYTAYTNGSTQNAIIITGLPNESTNNPPGTGTPNPGAWFDTSNGPFYAESYIMPFGSGNNLYHSTSMWWSPNFWPSGGEYDIMETGGTSTSTLHTSANENGPHDVWASGSIVAGQWNHVAGLYTSTGGTTYHNGIKMGTLSGPLSGPESALSLGYSAYQSGDAAYGTPGTSYFRFARVWQ